MNIAQQPKYESGQYDFRCLWWSESLILYLSDIQKKKRFGTVNVKIIKRIHDNPVKEYVLNVEYIKERAKHFGLSYYELGLLSGNGEATISRLLTGRGKGNPRVDTVMRICDTLKIKDIRKALIIVNT